MVFNSNDGGAASGSAHLQSEEAIVQRFLAPLAAGFAGALGLRDDCAFAAPSPGCEFVFKTDAIASGVHFLPDDSPVDIGWKALAVNVSDLAAKGAQPVCYLLSLSFPEAPSEAWMELFTRGLAQAQAAFGVQLMGGDTDRRPGPLSITPMMVGELAVGTMVRRGAAKAGDVICVSGTLGDSALGLSLRVDAGLARSWGLNATQVDHLVGRYLRPQPRLALAAPLRRFARAGMDVSDGLMKDLGRMCRASGVGAIVDHAALPASPAFAAVRQSAPDAAAAALFAGDDYEILCAVAPEKVAQFMDAARAVGVAITDIGRFTEGAEIELRDDTGHPMAIGGTGWDHF